jgi:hypothetical protein
VWRNCVKLGRILVLCALSFYNIIDRDSIRIAPILADQKSKTNPKN